MKKFYPIIVIVGLFVIVLGVISWQQRSRDVGVLPIGGEQNQVEQPSASEQQAQVSSEVVSSWKTYRNEKYGFKFNYPTDWEISGSWLVRPSKQTGALGIFIDTTSFDSIQQWLNNEFAGRKPIGIPKYQNITIGNIPAIRFSDPEGIGGCAEDFVFIKDYNVFRFLRHAETCDLENELFDQILSTFKFLN